MGDDVAAGGDVKVRILVVDDEVDLQQLVRQQMRREIRSGRYEFEFAHNGEEGLERLREGRFDIMLSDINMPVMDGLTLLSKLPEVSPDLRAVMVSAYGDMDNIRTAMNHGAFDFVTKPVNFKDLKVTIERTIEDLLRWREAASARDKLAAIQHDLNVAQTIQQNVLPTDFPETAAYDIYAKVVEARLVGGDFYDIYAFEDGRVGVVVADVSDKGMPAAMFMMASRTVMKAYALAGESPARALGRANRVLADENDAMTFVTLFYGIYDPGTQEFLYANGGHNAPIIVRPGPKTELLEATGGIPLGVAEDFEYRESSVALEPGAMVVMYSDGVSEAERTDGQMFEMERFCKIFEDGAFDSARQATDAVFAGVREFVGDSPQSDDITCMVLRVA